MAVETTEYKDRQVLSKILEAPRYACSLGGALETVMAIHRAIPFVHSAPGCDYNLDLGYHCLAGYQGTRYVGGSMIPCSRLIQKDVIFGAEEKLESLIRSGLDIMDGDLFVVLTGCAADLIGDDIGRVVKRFSNAAVPIFYTETGGYKGNAYRGHELVLKALIDQMAEQTSATVQKGLVNVFGVMPTQDVFWRGDLREIHRLLEKLGLKANMLFDHPRFGLDAWKTIPSAELNVVLSPWVGVAVVEELQQRFNTPYLVFPQLPVGPSETGSMLRQIAERTNIPKHRVDKVIAEEEWEFYRDLDNVADLYVDYGMQFDFVIIGDSNYVTGITRFLTNDAGCVPFTAVVTDDPPDQYRARITSELTGLDYRLKPEVIFESNSGQIWEKLEKSEANLLLGSSLDKPLARLLAAAHLSVSYPMSDRVVINNPYCGYRGALELLRDIYTAVLQTAY